MLTNSVIGPKCYVAARITCATSSGRVTSPLTANPLPPAAWISDTACSSSVCVRAVTATAGYAMLSPDTGVASGFAANPVGVQTGKVTKLYAKLSIKFGGEKKAEETPAPAVRKAPARRR